MAAFSAFMSAGACKFQSLTDLHAVHGSKQALAKSQENLNRNLSNLKLWTEAYMHTPEDVKLAIELRDNNQWTASFTTAKSNPKAGKMKEISDKARPVIIWLLVGHSAQREIRDRHHYSVDCVVAIYVGILLWKMTSFWWPAKDASKERRIAMLEKIQGRLTQAAKDNDIDEVRELLREVELGSQESQNNKGPSTGMWLFGCAIIVTAITIVLLALTLTSGG